MKKILSFIAMTSLCGAALVGCVDDNQSVLLKGLVAGDSCNATGDNTMLSGIATPAFDCELWQCVDTTSILAYVNVVNNNVSDTVWSSSGGSSSGSTLDYDIPNYNMIYVDKVTVKCLDVDGDKSKCDGVSDVIYKMNVPTTAGGGMCHQTMFDFSSFVALLGNTVNIEIVAHYHDTGNIKGDTNAVVIPIVKAECSEETASRTCELKADGDLCVNPNQCKGGICEPEDEGSTRNVCKSPQKENENPNGGK